MALVAYTISFNAGQGSGSVPSTMTGTAESGTSISLPSSPHPTRDHYNFAGWSSSNGSSSGSYSLLIKGSTAYTKTMYAAFAKRYITIKYNSNGGSSVASQSVGEYDWFNITSTVPTKTGYTFQGWEYGGNVYASGASARFTAGVTLTAVWQAITYTVQYNMNGGTGSIANQTKTYGQTLTLSATVPTRTNYTFKGWSTSNTATTPTYAASGSYTANASATLYAVWELAIRTLTLSFNANGGSNPPSSLSVETAESAYSFQVPQQAVDTPYYDHHIFLGWSTEEDGAVEYTYPMSITIQQNTTLYAVWRLETFTIAFNANGGSNSPASITKTYGQGIFLPLIAPTKEGYNFLGWDTSSAGNVVVYEAGDLYEEEESVVLYAVWQIKTYTVTYNANGGSDAPASQTKTYNVSVTLSPDRPTRASYIFVGWGITNLDTTPSYQPNSPYTVNADLNLHAIWKEATYDSADLFVDGDSCEVFIKGSLDAIYGADVIMI